MFSKSFDTINGDDVLDKSLFWTKVVICWDISGAPALDSSGHFSSIPGAVSSCPLSHDPRARNPRNNQRNRKLANRKNISLFADLMSEKRFSQLFRLDNWYEECQTFWFEHFSRRYQVIIVRLGRDRNMMILVPWDIQQFTSNKYSAILNAVQGKSDGKG